MIITQTEIKYKIMHAYGAREMKYNIRTVTRAIIGEGDIFIYLCYVRKNFFETNAKNN